jgi:hypothetical protein
MGQILVRPLAYLCPPPSSLLQLVEAELANSPFFEDKVIFITYLP